MAVPNYCLGQSLDYLAARGFSKDNFSEEQLSEEKEMMIPKYRDDDCKALFETRYESLGYKKVKIKCASGTYPTWTKEESK